jgi:cytochrome P450
MVDYDPYQDEIMRDPYRIYRQLRDESPVHYIEQYDCWFLSRFDVVWDAACDSSHLRTLKGTTPGHLLTRDTPSTMSLNAYDPPEHAERRVMVKPHFQPAGLAPLRRQISELTRELVDELLERGEGDLVRDFGAKIATTGALAAGGMPIEMRDQAIEWSNGIMHRTPGHKGATDVVAQAGREMFFWCLEFTKKMREDIDKATGMLQTLLTSEVDGEPLDDASIASTLALVMIGGSDTFPKALGNTLYRLWQHPDQRAQVAKDPKLARAAFLEALRLDTPTQMLGRTCVEACDIRGQRIEPGQGVMFMWAAANRDEREFDQPDRFDIHRRARRMLAFGQGAHMCIGHHIAKMEAEVALHELLARAPNYEIRESDARRNRTEFVQGWMELPATFGS